MHRSHIKINDKPHIADSQRLVFPYFDLILDLSTCVNQRPCSVYKRYVDDTLSVMTDAETASEFLMTLNNSHPSINFTMMLEENGRLPFLGMEVI